MIEIDGNKYYTPREITDNKMITNRKGKKDYGFVLRLIRDKQLDAKIFNPKSKVPYYLVSEEAVAEYINTIIE